MKTLGIVGGLSPESTALFYTRLADLSRAGIAYPHVIIDSVPLAFSTERDIIGADANRDALLPYVAASVRRLQHADVIVVPCNTAHLFIEKLRAASRAPILSIIDAVTERVLADGHRTVGLLATTTTVQSGMYRHERITFIAPEHSDQEKLSAIILAIIKNEVTDDQMADLRRIGRKLGQRCDIVLLACTDLHVLRGNYIDSLDVLVEAAYSAIGGD